MKYQSFFEALKTQLDKQTGLIGLNKEISITQQLFCEIWVSRLFLLIEFLSARDPNFFQNQHNVECLAGIIGKADAEILRYPPFRILELITNNRKSKSNLNRIKIKIKRFTFYYLFLLYFYFWSNVIKSGSLVIVPKQLKKSNVKTVLKEHIRSADLTKMKIIYKNNYNDNYERFFLSSEYLNILVSELVQKSELNSQETELDVFKKAIILLEKVLEYIGPEIRKHFALPFQLKPNIKLFFINYDNSIFRDLACCTLSNNPVSDVFAFQHGGGFYLLNSFPYLDPFLPMYRERFFDCLGHGKRYSYKNSENRGKVWFGDEAIYYPQSLEPEKKMSVRYVDKASSAQADVLLKALEITGENYFLRAHPLGTKNDVTNIAKDDYVVYGRRPEIVGGIKLVVFDSPDPSILREIINEEIPYIYIFRKVDYEFTPFGERYFGMQKENGRFYDLSEYDQHENVNGLADTIRKAMKK